MIVVMGAGGATGGATLRSLAALGAPSRALSRDPARLAAGLDDRTLALTETLPADAVDPNSLREAFRGAHQLFLTMANGPHQVQHELAAIDAAVESGVEHIVKISAPAAEPDSPVAVSRGHHLVEERLRTSGVTATVLRPYAFMQKLLLLAPGIAAAGVVHGAMGQARCNYVDARDIGDAAAEVLTRPEARRRNVSAHRRPGVQLPGGSPGCSASCSAARSATSTCPRPGCTPTWSSGPGCRPGWPPTWWRSSSSRRSAGRHPTAPSPTSPGAPRAPWRRSSRSTCTAFADRPDTIRAPFGSLSGASRTPLRRLGGPGGRAGTGPGSRARHPKGAAFAVAWITIEN